MPAEYVHHMEYIKSIKRQPIDPSDVFQFSSFENATDNLCSIIVCTENAGLNSVEIGKLLMNDGVPRTETAFRKYGENHIKVAEAIGLAFKDNASYYLSPIGCVYDKLSDTEKSKLLTRLLLRSKLISQLLSTALKGPFSMESFLYDLAESTYRRRRYNVRFVIEKLNDAEEYSFAPITSNIII